MNHPEKRKRRTAAELGVPKLGPPPAATSAAVSRSMRGNRAKDTAPEVRLRRALWATEGLRGYRLRWQDAPGRPDIAYPERRLAIFVHGCYWHRCPHCARPLPRANADFWERKFVRNQERDQRKRRELEEAGWRVLEIWECQVRKDLEVCVALVRDEVRSEAKVVEAMVLGS